MVSGEEISEEETGIHLAFYVCSDDPTHYYDTAKEERWKDAMKAEILSIEKNHTWELIDLLQHAKTIGGKWV